MDDNPIFYGMSVREFLDAKDMASNLCTDNDSGVYCRRAVSDLSHRLLFGVGSRREAFESGKHIGRELMFLDPSIDFNDTFSFSNLEFIKQSINTHSKVCSPLKRDLKKSFEKLKEEKTENYLQCLQGIDKLKQSLEMFRNRDIPITHKLF